MHVHVYIHVCILIINSYNMFVNVEIDNFDQTLQKFCIGSY